MAPRSALVLVSFAVASFVVVPCRGDEPAELPPLPPPVVSTAAPGPAATAPSAAAGASAAPSAAPVTSAPTPVPDPPTQAPVGAAPDPEEESRVLAEKRRRVHRSSWSRDTSLGAIAVGGGLVGAGWMLSVIHGLIGEVAGIDCHKANGGYTATISCDDTDNYGPIFIPVVGPFVEAATHEGTLSDADKGFLAIEGILQAGGLVTALVGLASLPVTTGSDKVSVRVTPAVGAKGAGLGVIGSF